MIRTTLFLVLFATPAFSASPAERALDFVDAHVSPETQLEWFQAYGDLHESLRKSVKKAGKIVRQESRRIEDAVLDWSKQHEKHVRRTVKQWAAGRR